MQIDGTGQTISCPKEEVTVVYPDKYRIKQKQTPTEEEMAAMLLEDKEPGQEKNRSGKNHQKK